MLYIAVINKERFKRFFLKRSIIDPITNCWLYKLKLSGGYARVTYENQRNLLHRLSLHVYKEFDLNSHLDALHIQFCPNKNCWNPEHLYAGTEKQNSADSVAIGTHHLGRRTHCKYGHLLDSKFKSWDRDKSHRYCSICRTERVRRWRAKTKALANEK